MGYSEEEIREKCKKAIQKPEEFYKCKIDTNSCLVNYRGKTTDKPSRYYTEVIAEFLAKEDSLELLRHISGQSRKVADKSYNMKHEGKYLYSDGTPIPSDKIAHNKEKIIAIDLFNQSKKEGPFDYIGDIIDYQTPLKAWKDDHYGEIDLLAVNHDDRKVYILELKKNTVGTSASPETLLRCVLEAYTYYKIVDKEWLLESFGLTGYDIVISPLVFRKDRQYEEWIELKNGKRKWLKELVSNLDVKVDFFFLESKGKNTYRVLKE